MANLALCTGSLKCRVGGQCHERPLEAPGISKHYRSHPRSRSLPSHIHNRELDIGNELNCSACTLLSVYFLQFIPHLGCKRELSAYRRGQKIVASNTSHQELFALGTYCLGVYVGMYVNGADPPTNKSSKWGSRCSRFAQIAFIVI